MGHLRELRKATENWVTSAQGLTRRTSGKSILEGTEGLAVRKLICVLRIVQVMDMCVCECRNEHRKVGCGHAQSRTMW